jgi:hypothetical protein
MARLVDFQNKIDEAIEEVCHLTQDDHDRRPQHQELRQEGSFNEDEWYDDFNHGTFAFDDASPLAAELHATHGHNITSHLSYPCTMGTQTQSNF